MSACEIQRGCQGEACVVVARDVYALWEVSGGRRASGLPHWNAHGELVPGQNGWTESVRAEVLIHECGKRSIVI
jgi:hypothetical protein